ncbi:DNA repair protein RecO [Gammaproteobacteria bacterium]|nr:DNA repair protein RecO [Gammaproteobacteria bacterium]
MRVSDEPLYILRRQPWSETSWLLDLFTRHHGRLTVIAKGARRMKSPWRSLVSPFQPLVGGWSGKGEVPSLTALDGDVYYDELSAETMICASYINELLIRFTQRSDPHESLFESYQQCLAALANGSAPPPILRRFEIAILRETGYRPHFDQDTSGVDLSDDRRYGIVDGEQPVKLIPGQGRGFSARTLRAIGDGSSQDYDSPEMRRAMRHLIERHLTRPLATRDVLAQVRRLRGKS